MDHGTLTGGWVWVQEEYIVGVLRGYVTAWDWNIDAIDGGGIMLMVQLLCGHVDDLGWITML